MKVKDIILKAATILGIADEIEAYWDGSSTDGAEHAALLLQSFNTVENELALDYLPLYAEDELVTKTGRIAYSQLDCPAVRILRAENEWGVSVPFDLFPDHLKTQPGVVRVRYTYTPTEKGLEDESDFRLLASERLFSYGIAAEFCLALGRFEDASAWEKKYREAVRAAYELPSNRKIRSRRWC